MADADHPLVLLGYAPVRRWMVAEAEADLIAGTAYVGSQLTHAGGVVWPRFLLEALADHTPEWLAAAMSPPSYWQETHIQHLPGGPVVTTVPPDAAEELAVTEFLQYYIRAVCLATIDAGGTAVEVVEALPPRTGVLRPVATATQRRDAQAVLDDVRANSASYTALGSPPGPTSGLAVVSTIDLVTK